jgi:hypothetical protein
MGCFVKNKKKFQYEKQLILTSWCKEVNRTDPSPSVRIPRRVLLFMMKIVMVAKLMSWIENRFRIEEISTKSQFLKTPFFKELKLRTCSVFI